MGLKMGENAPFTLVPLIMFHYLLDHFFILLILGSNSFVCPLREIRACTSCSSLCYWGACDNPLEVWQQAVFTKGMKRKTNKSKQCKTGLTREYWI